MTITKYSLRKGVEKARGVEEGRGEEDRQKRSPGARPGIRENRRTGAEALFSPGPHKAVITRKL